MECFEQSGMLVQSQGSSWNCVEVFSLHQLSARTVLAVSEVPPEPGMFGAVCILQLIGNLWEQVQTKNRLIKMRSLGENCCLGYTPETSGLCPWGVGVGTMAMEEVARPKKGQSPPQG